MIVRAKNYTLIYSLVTGLADFSICLIGRLQIMQNDVIVNVTSELPHFELHNHFEMSHLSSHFSGFLLTIIVHIPQLCKDVTQMILTRPCSTRSCPFILF